MCAISLKSLIIKSHSLVSYKSVTRPLHLEGATFVRNDTQVLQERGSSISTTHNRFDKLLPQTVD